MSNGARSGVLVGALWGLIYFTLPTGVLSESFWVVGAAGLAVGGAVVVRRLPSPRIGWGLVAAGQICFVAGDVIFNTQAVVLEVEPFPGPADVLYLSSYAITAVGLTHLARGKGGRLRLQPTIDGLILSAAAGLAVWVFFVQPALVDGAGPALERLVSAAYPIGDLLLLMTCAQLAVHRRAPAVSLRLLVVAISANLVGDLWFLLLERSGSYEVGHPVDALWWTAYVITFAAIAHPSAGAVATGRPPRSADRLTATRLALLSVAALGAPLLQALVNVGADLPFDPLILAGTCGLFALVIARLWLVANDLETSRAEQRHLATHDHLTGLANRALFSERLYEAERRGTTDGVVLLIDIDFFKEVNDTYGHLAGDEVLRTVARRLVDAVPEGALLARIGGDEFAVLLVDSDVDPAVVARDLVEVARRPVDIGRARLTTTISCGGALFNRGQQVLHAADDALYAAKRHGRDGFVLTTVVEPAVPPLTLGGDGRRR